MCGNLKSRFSLGSRHHCVIAFTNPFPLPCQLGVHCQAFHMCSEKDRDIDLASLQDQWIPGPVGCQKILRISTERLKKSQGLIYQSNPTLEPVVKWCSCQCFKPSADATAVTKTSGNRPARPHALSMRDLAQVDMAYCNA